MDSAQLKRIQEWFNQYVDRFRQDGQLIAMQQLKLDHSLRVAQDAEGVARDLGWDQREVNVAAALGLLHDVGRFEQFAQYGTFYDPISVNHAQKGYEVLLEENPLANLNESDRHRILSAVRYHNRKTLPDNLDADTLRFAQLARDADKLDIYFVVHDAIITGLHRKHRDLLWEIDLDGPPNPSLVECVKKRQMGSQTEVRSLADYLLMQLGWTYDINFPATMQRIRQRSVLENICSHLPDTQEIRNAAKSSFEFRDRFLSAKK